MDFVRVMDAMHLGENGTCEYGDAALPPALALFNAGVRGVDSARINTLTRALVATGARGIVDCALLVMQARDVRGGKGERALALVLLRAMHTHAPAAARSLVRILPEYGCWRDITALIAAERAEAATRGGGPGLDELAIALFVEQLRADDAMLAMSADARISLAGKWAPRAGKHWGAYAREFARRMYAPSPTADAEYRRLLARLTTRIDPPERAMCARRFAEINIKHVPARAMHKYRAALLNELRGSPPTAAQDETGNRHPHNADRVACRKRVRDACARSTVKGARLLPHELVRGCMNASAQSQSAAERVLADTQWQAILDDTRGQMALADGAGLDLGNMIALVDVSGSMSGTPMEVAIALGLIVQELAAPAFRGRVLTFESKPSWVKVPQRDAAAGVLLKDAVAVVRAADWGGSTDIARALECVLEACARARCAPADVPELIVFSDMQFDQAHRGDPWETAHARLVQRFAEVGTETIGEPWGAPRVTYWNLRGDTAGHVARADTPGVRMLSGFSPALLRHALAGTDEPTSTPWSTLRACLDASRYDLVRATVAPHAFSA